MVELIPRVTAVLLQQDLEGAELVIRGDDEIDARSIDIESPDGFPFHVDGEVVATDRRRLTVRLHPRALRVRVPSAARLSG